MSKFIYFSLAVVLGFFAASQAKATSPYDYLNLSYHNGRVNTNVLPPSITRNMSPVLSVQNMARNRFSLRSSMQNTGNIYLNTMLQRIYRPPNQNFRNRNNFLF